MMIDSKNKYQDDALDHEEWLDRLTLTARFWVTAAVVLLTGAVLLSLPY